MASLDEHIEAAKARLLHRGVKPEDYYFLDPNLPLRIAKMIVREARHHIKYGDPRAIEAKFRELTSPR